MEFYCLHGIGKSAILDESDDNRPQPRRLSRNPRREGYERDNSYVGMTDADISRSRWVAGIDDEIHREPVK